jgi:glucosamine kinase
VYNQEMPSRFLGSFSHFIFQNLNEPYCDQLVRKNFSDFFEKNVMKYEGYKKMKVHFTGSVSFYFSNLLRQVAKEKNITVQHILESPIAGLTLYHQKDLNN